MTDIVGFTEATVHQSRSDIDTLLAAHNRVLLPIVKRYRGRHIKSIGDALLLVFRSPTDAMLCAMSMQDALHELNCRAPQDRQIRIRIGASVGEVRVTNNDVFGEPVNLTSRVSGITPGNEIYFSEALHMAMNKAEVPSREVGWKELKGIAQPVRIYSIPRFSPLRLAPEVMAMKDLTDLIYPYGGSHLPKDNERSSVVLRFKKFRRGLGARLSQLFDRLGAALAQPRARYAAIAALALPIALGAYFGIAQLMQRPALTEPLAAADPAPVAKPPLQTAVVETPPIPVPAQTSAVKPTATKARTTDRPATARKASLTPAKGDESKSLQTLSAVKRAFNERKIGKDEFERLNKKIADAKDWDIRQVKLDYEVGKLSTQQYNSKVKDIERKYE